MTETTLRAIAEAGAHSVTAPPALAEKVLAGRRRSTRRRRSGALALAGLVGAAGIVAARPNGNSRFFAEFVPSEGMAPTVNVEELLIADRELDPTYGDVVVIELAADDGFRFHTIRRVIGLPGDVIACPAGPDGRCTGWTRNGAVLHEPYAHDETGQPFGPVHVAPGGIFVLGDARDRAIDSRQSPPSSLTDVLGVGVEVRDTHGRRRPVLGAPPHTGPGSRNVDPGEGRPPSRERPAKVLMSQLPTTLGGVG
jgi:signal peptidase I